MGQGADLRLGNDQRTKAGMNITGDNTGESKSLAEGQEMNTGGRYQRQQHAETIAHERRSIKQGRAAGAQQCPKLLDFIVGRFLSHLSISLQTNDQSNTISKLLQVLVESDALGGPVTTSVVTESLQR